MSAAVGSSGQKWGNTYGLSPQFLESLWINGPLVTRVFVANVSYITNFSTLFLNITMRMNMVTIDNCGFCQSDVCTHACYSRGNYQRYSHVFCWPMSGGQGTGSVVVLQSGRSPV